MTSNAKTKGPLDHLTPAEQEHLVELVKKLGSLIGELAEAVEREERAKAS